MAHYPDNSVLCHANRWSGGYQDTFIGGGALAVQVQGCLSFFPAVYNEDWLFLYDWLARRAVSLAGQVRQITYNPFADPARARREEFGDVLGEGMFDLLHRRQRLSRARLPAYWEPVIHARQELIERIERRLTRLVDRVDSDLAANSVSRSLATARARLEEIRPASLAEFVRVWRDDLHAWNVRLAQLPQLNTVADALTWLGLSEFVIR